MDYEQSEVNVITFTKGWYKGRYGFLNVLSNPNRCNAKYARGVQMQICYNKLWKLLIDKSMNKKKLREISGISSASVAKLEYVENITNEVLLRICTALKCVICDIMEVVEDDKCDEKFK